MVRDRAIGEIRNTYRILEWIAQCKRSLRDVGCRWADNIKTYFGELVCEGEVRFDLYKILQMTRFVNLSINLRSCI